MAFDEMARFIRFIVQTDHPSRTRCTGVVGSLRIAMEAGKLPDYQQEHVEEIFQKLNDGMPCPPFDDKKWSDCVCWFKDNEESQTWISLFRDIIAILEDADLRVSMLTTQRPGMIVYEDAVQVVAKPWKF